MTLDTYNTAIKLRIAQNISGMMDNLQLERFFTTLPIPMLENKQKQTNIKSNANEPFDT